MIKTLKLYRTENGKEPFSEWFVSLKDRVVRARVKTRLDRLAVGHMGDCKFVSKGVYELRIHYGPGYRVYFSTFEENIILLLIGGEKQTQNKDIEKAQQYWKDFQEHCL